MLTTLIALLVHGQPPPAAISPVAISPVAIKPVARQSGSLKLSESTVSDSTVSDSTVPDATVPDATVPVCYIQFQNGQLRDLGRLCGKRSTSSGSFRNVQKPIVQPDDDDDDPTPRVTPKPLSTKPLSTSSQPTPGSTIAPPQARPQSTFSPAPSSFSKPASVQLSPAPPSTNTLGYPHPLAIPEDSPSRD